MHASRRATIFLMILILTTASLALAQGRSSAYCELAGDGELPLSGDQFFGMLWATDITDVKGTWKHFNAMGDRLIVRPDLLVCRPNGLFLVDITGPGRLNGNPVMVEISIEDRGGSNTDFYQIVATNPDGSLAYRVSGVTPTDQIRVHMP
jgi:hypothetical protein